MAILEATQIDPSAPSLSETIQGFSYSVRLAREELPCSDQEIHDKIQNFLTSSSCIITKKTGGKIREKDIRPFVEGLILCADSFSFQMQIKWLNNGTLNPYDLLQNIFPVLKDKLQKLYITKTDTSLKFRF
jgi:hypothetical protein